MREGDSDEGAIDGWTSCRGGRMCTYNGKKKEKKRTPSIQSNSPNECKERQRERERKRERDRGKGRE